MLIGCGCNCGGEPPSESTPPPSESVPPSESESQSVSESASESASSESFEVVYSECIALFGCDVIPRKIGLTTSMGPGTACNCVSLNGFFTLEFCRCYRNSGTNTTFLEYWAPSGAVELYLSGFDVLCRDRLPTLNCETSPSPWRLVANRVDGNTFYNVEITGFLYSAFGPTNTIPYRLQNISLDCLFGSHSAPLVPSTGPCTRGSSVDFAPA